MTFQRRDFLKYAGAGLLAMGGPLAFGRQSKAAREKELNILCWEGYNSADVLDPFRTAHDAEVRAESLTNDPTMINRLRGGETNVWDLINVNNPWARDVMYPEKLIQKLDRERFEGYFDAMLPSFKPPYQWSLSADGKDLIGMAQRFGPYSFVVNTDKVSRDMAEDQGWDLFNDAAMSGRYGIQETEDWQIFDLCMISGFDPYVRHNDPQVAKFEDTAKRMFKNAALVSDLATMNQALIAGEIDAYWPGGTYSCSPARADGNLNIRAVTPRRGPGAGGKGGISWVEITSVVNNPQLSPLATEFLAYVQEPDVSHTVAFAEGTFNPVSQMGNPACFELFTKEQLEIIQWDSLEEEMANSVEYNIVPDYARLLEIMTAARRG